MLFLYVQQITFQEKIKRANGIGGTEDNRYDKRDVLSKNDKYYDEIKRSSAFSSKKVFWIINSILELIFAGRDQMKHFVELKLWKWKIQMTLVSIMIFSIVDIIRELEMTRQNRKRITYYNVENITFYYVEPLIRTIRSTLYCRWHSV